MEDTKESVVELSVDIYTIDNILRKNGIDLKLQEKSEKYVLNLMNYFMCSILIEHGFNMYIEDDLCFKDSNKIKDVFTSLFIYNQNKVHDDLNRIREKDNGCEMNLKIEKHGTNLYKISLQKEKKWA